jgi:hypothetical protein
MRTFARAAVAALLGVTAAGALTVAPGSQAVAQRAPDNVVSPATDIGQRRMQQQRPLVKAATVLRWEIERRSYPGFAGIALEESQVALWWKGPVPASMRTVVAQATRTARIQLKTAAHSLAELKAAARRIRAASPGPVVHAIKLPADGSGLIVGADPRAGATALAARLPRVGVPVTIVHEEPLKPTSRDDDWAPWSGGATIVNRTRGAACTSGFGVRNGSNAKYILTAAHCGQVGDRFTDGRGEWIGDVGPRHQDHDIALIPTSNVEDRIYVGDRNSNNGLTVDDWGWTFVGEYLCQSGVTSAGVLGGPICNIKVLFYWDDREDLVEAEQMNGQAVARGGDSGGPVYSGSASGGVIAKGTVTRSAGPRLGFQDFGTAWRDFGISIAK